MKTCQMTLSDNGKFNGVENYWECGKPAVAILLKDRLRPNLRLCNRHKLMVDKRRAKRKLPPAKWRLL
jgi:hypothetical protein